MPFYWQLLNADSLSPESAARPEDTLSPISSDCEGECGRELCAEGLWVRLGDYGEVPACSGLNAPQSLVGAVSAAAGRRSRAQRLQPCEADACRHEGGALPPGRAVLAVVRGVETYA